MHTSLLILSLQLYARAAGDQHDRPSDRPAGPAGRADMWLYAQVFFFTARACKGPGKLLSTSIQAHYGTLHLRIVCCRPATKITSGTLLSCTYTVRVRSLRACTRVMTACQYKCTAFLVWPLSAVNAVQVQRRAETAAVARVQGRMRVAQATPAATDVALVTTPEVTQAPTATQ